MSSITSGHTDIAYGDIHSLTYSYSTDYNGLHGRNLTESNGHYRTIAHFTDHIG